MAVGDETSSGEEEACTEDTGISTDKQPKASDTGEKPMVAAEDAETEVALGPKPKPIENASNP